MEKDIALQDAQISSQRLLQIIREEYEKSETGSMKGYLDQKLGLISRREACRLCRLEGDETASFDRGSVLCHEPNEELRTMTGLYISACVRCDLLEELKKYPFKEWALHFELIQEYRYYKDKIWKRRQDTLYMLPFFSVNIKW